MSQPHSPTPAGEPGASVDPHSVEGLFVAALARTDPDERRAFLDAECGQVPERRRRVEALLLAYEDAGSFLERPPLAGTVDLDFDFLAPSSDPGLLGTLGPYEVFEMIGRGGMGIVFRARDPKLNRVVAVKVMVPQLAANPNARRRFVREAHAAAAVSHPHVVTIHAVEKDAPLPYLVMECVVGQSLQQKLDKQGSLRLTEILRIATQVAEGLAAAHQQGLIHRDIKPANILLENGVERVKITDFGLARAVDDISVTRTGEVSGTPQFMAPEQAKGERVDHRSDLFSLGCVMYAMCTGRSPFRATSMAAAIRRVCDDLPRPIEEINPEVPQWLIEIVNRLLEKDPDQRFQSADELVAVLNVYLADIQAARPISHRIAHGAAGEPAGKQRATGSSPPVPRWLLTDVTFPFRVSQAVEGTPPRQHSLGALLSVLGTLIFGVAVLLLLLPPLLAMPRVAFPYRLEFVIPCMAFGLIMVTCGTVLRRGSISSAGMLVILILLLGPLGLVIWLLRREYYQRQEELFGKRQSLAPHAPAAASHTGDHLPPPGGVGGTRALVLLVVLLTVGAVFGGVLPLDNPTQRIAPAILGLLIGIGLVGADLIERLFGRVTRLPPNAVFGPLRAGQQGALFLVLSSAYLVPYVIRAINSGVSFWEGYDYRPAVVVTGILCGMVWLWYFWDELLPATASKGETWMKVLIPPLLAGLAAVGSVWGWPALKSDIAGGRGSLSIESAISGPIVHVTVDGETPQVVVRNPQMWTVYDLLPGRHKVGVQLSGGQQFWDMVIIKADRTERLVVPHLAERAPPVPASPPPTGEGAVIVEFAAAGLKVRLQPPDDDPAMPGMAPHGFVLSEGTYQVPAGKYVQVVTDLQYGWADNVPGGISGAGTFESDAGMYGMDYGDVSVLAESGMGMAGYGPGYGTSGMLRLPQYKASVIDVTPGEFTTLNVRRDLAELARKPPRWEEGKFVEFFWNGKRYALSSRQGRIVQKLFEEFVAGAPDVTESELLELGSRKVTSPDPFFPPIEAAPNAEVVPAATPAESAAAESPVPSAQTRPQEQKNNETVESLLQIFSDGKHPAWGELIVEGVQPGSYRLAPARDR